MGLLWLVGLPQFCVMAHNAKMEALGEKMISTNDISEKISYNFCLNIEHVQCRGGVENDRQISCGTEII